MTNELDRAIATINRHLLYAKLCAVFIQNGNPKSCLQMMGIDLDTADEEPTPSAPPELPSPDNVEPSSLETSTEPTQNEPPSPSEISPSPSTNSTESSNNEKPKRRGRKKKREVLDNQDEFDEAYKKAYSEVMKDDRNGQTNG